MFKSIQSAIVVIIVVVVLYFLYDKFVKEDEPTHLETRQSKTDEWVETEKDVYRQDVTAQFSGLAKTLFDDIDCVFCLRNCGIYGSLLKLSPQELTEFYHYFNDTYSHKWNGQTLTAAMKEEGYGMDTGWGFWDALGCDDAYKLISKLEKLNLF